MVNFYQNKGFYVRLGLNGRRGRGLAKGRLLVEEASISVYIGPWLSLSPFAMQFLCMLLYTLG
jgi:hypothetical protein